MCASPFYNSVNMWLRNLQTSTPLFTDVHGLCIHVVTSKYEEIFESLSVYVCVCTILSGGVNKGPIAQALKLICEIQNDKKI